MTITEVFDFLKAEADFETVREVQAKLNRGTHEWVYSGNSVGLVAKGTMDTFVIVYFSGDFEISCSC